MEGAPGAGAVSALGVAVVGVGAGAVKWPTMSAMMPRGDSTPPPMRAFFAKPCVLASSSSRDLSAMISVVQLGEVIEPSSASLPLT